MNDISIDWLRLYLGVLKRVGLGEILMQRKGNKYGNGVLERIH